jgi:hypothetical protein
MGLSDAVRGLKRASVASLVVRIWKTSTNRCMCARVVRDKRSVMLATSSSWLMLEGCLKRRMLEDIGLTETTSVSVAA